MVAHTSTRKFPQELLEQGINSRVSYFERLTIEHQKLLNVRKQLMDVVYKAGGHNIALVYGPMGVGKTTFIKRIVKIVCDQERDKPGFSPSDVPAIYTRLWSPENGNFNWSEFYIDLGLAYPEPLPESKIRYDFADVIVSGIPVLTKSGPIRDLRYGAIKNIKFRRTRLVFVDEAAHLLKIANARKLRNQMDTVKVIADDTDSLIILVGTYDLLQLSQLSGQLDRRTVEIHFPRYDFTNRVPDENGLTDKDYFTKVVLSLQSYLPLDREPDLLPMTEFLYEKSLGCIGMLKDWLTDGLKTALSDGNSKGLTKKILEKHAPANKRLITRVDEIMAGELTLRERNDPKHQTLLRAKLGLAQPSDVEPSTPPQNALIQELKPGQRRPIRDKVGG